MIFIPCVSVLKHEIFICECIFFHYINNNIYYNKYFLIREKPKYLTTYSDGYLGSRNDEERSEMRYVMRIAEFSESSNL